MEVSGKKGNSMKPDFHHPKLDSWSEWKDRCAIRLCGNETKGDLLKFGVPRIIGRFAEFNLKRLLVFEAGDTEIKCWHFFESYMHDVSKTTGKRWKDWLFEKAALSTDPATTVLEKESQYCIKTAVDRHLREEGEIKSTIVERGSITMETFLSSREDQTDARLPHITKDEKRSFDSESEGRSPDPGEEVGRKELRLIARALAQEYFTGLEHHARVAILADSMDISLKNPVVEAAAGRKSSVLYACLNSAKSSRNGKPGKYGQVFIELRGLADKKYESDDPDTFNFLIAAAILALSEIAYLWGKSEKSLKDLFSLEDN